MSKKITVILGLLLAVVFSVLVFLPADSSYQSFEGRIYGTQYRVLYRPSDKLNSKPETIQAEVEKKLQRIDQVASSWKADSEISHYNQSQSVDGAHDANISRELKELLDLSEKLKIETNGAFDPRYQGDDIDLSAIAKGYAVDCVCELLEEEFHLEDFLVEIGGEIKALGVNSAEKAWAVAIYQPQSHDHVKELQVALINTSIATSGQYFKDKHIKDAKTRKAPVHDLLSCSVIHTSNATADALATALMVMGTDLGLNWANQNKVQALFINNDGTIIKSRAWQE